MGAAKKFSPGDKSENSFTDIKPFQTILLFKGAFNPYYKYLLYSLSHLILTFFPLQALKERKGI
jgi:hypothetical protein